MTVKNIVILFCTISLLLVYSISTAKDNVDKTGKFNSREPIQITADRLDAYNEKKMAVFSGNAVVKQADWVLKTDRLTIFYHKEADKKEKIGGKEIEGTGDLEKIEARGNVVVTQGMRVAVSDEAVYFQDSGQIVMTGNPMIRENKNKVVGCRIIIYLKEDRGTVEKCEGKKVQMEIHPEEKDAKKK
jgi:lipopolysaccharide export system protein LptA